MERLTPAPEDLTALARLARGVSIFAPLTVGQLDLILPYVILYAYAPGETVFRQGAVGDSFFIVYEGKVRISVKSGWFGSKAIAEAGAGGFFGEMALLSRAPRTASVVCLTAAKLFVLAAQDFTFILRENPAFAAHIEKIAAHRRFDTEHRS